jgi:hypothetical protein
MPFFIATSDLMYMEIELGIDCTMLCGAFPLALEVFSFEHRELGVGYCIMDNRTTASIGSN